MLFTLAIRNIFRNKRRTFITIGAIAFAVFLSSTMSSFQKGVWDSVVENSVNMFFGYIQVHDLGYWEEQSLDKSMEYTDALKHLPAQIEEIDDFAPRLESLALASSENLTQGVMVIGIDPEKEDKLTKVHEKIVEGKYIRADDDGILITQGAASKLKLQLGDTLVMISQGYHGVNAAGKFPIRGIIDYALPELNKRLIYLPLKKAQSFYGAENRVTTLVMNIDSKHKVPGAVKALNNQLDIAQFEVMDYNQLMPEMVQARALDEGGSIIILGILYLLITFAIFGTILMMTKERSYEFGVLTAIGMRRWNLFGIVFTESVIVGIIGAIVGILLSIPIVYYLNQNPLNMLELGGEEMASAYEKFGMIPIFPAAFEFRTFFNQALLIFIISCILSIYPLIKILKMNPITAMRE